MDPAIREQLRTRIRDRGLRATAGRVSVLRTLEVAGRPLSHAEVMKQLTHLDRATVFRNLTDLLAAGLLHRFDPGDHIWRFECCRDAHHGHEHEHRDLHPHFTCEGCGEVRCLPPVELRFASQDTLPRSLRGGHITLQITGRCDACQESP